MPSKLQAYRTEIRDGYENGTSLADLAFIYKCSPGCVRNFLLRNGVQTRSTGGTRRLSDEDRKQRRLKSSRENHLKRKKQEQEQSIEWQQRNPNYAKFYHLKKRYGLTDENLQVLSEKQKHFCAICKTRPIRVVDHCHKTNAVRGLLCHQCNNGIGQLQDSIEILMYALAYLKQEK